MLQLLLHMHVLLLHTLHLLHLHHVLLLRSIMVLCCNVLRVVTVHQAVNRRRFTTIQILVRIQLRVRMHACGAQILFVHHLLLLLYVLRMLIPRV